MPIRLKTKAEIERLARGGEHLSAILKILAAEVRPGVMTKDLDIKARELIKNIDGEAAFLNYRPAGSRRPYPAALCVSIDDEIVHGLPSDRVLEEGEIVTLDLGLKFDGLFTDAAVTVPVGGVSSEVIKLIKATKKALKAGIKAIKPGGHMGDVGAAIDQVIKQSGLTVIEGLAGHGVGYSVHEDPFVPNEGQVGRGLKLEPGLVIAIEPMACLGKGDIVLAPDGFTYSTADGSISAHSEATVAVTERGVRILTPLL